jgi:hypothetical protein
VLGLAGIVPGANLSSSDPQRYRETNGVQTLAARRSLAINALAPDIHGRLSLLGWREPSKPSTG